MITAVAFATKPV